jgi:predicted 2-oxoglutarate/Fe(II)-dependent dioxygenase YbiX
MNIVKPGAFTINQIFNAEECKAMITRAEELGFEAAKVALSGGAQLMPGIRNNDRVKFDDRDLANLLWQRLREFVPPTLEGWHAKRLDENFAVYRYEPGQRFKRHQDGTIKTTALEESRFTVLVYLNDDCEGGETIFSDADRSSGRTLFLETPVQPKVGMALVFKHELWHEGAPVTAGRKYVLRTDVLYAKD